MCQAVHTGSKRFATFVTRIGRRTALVQIYPRTDQFRINFADEVACYETLSNGAFESARREVKKLENAS